MFRSISRVLAGAALVAAIPAISQAQVLSCYKIGANVAAANCSVVSDLTIETVAAMDITAAGPDFDLTGVTAAQWVGIIEGTTPVRVANTTPFDVDIASNANGFAVNISGSVSAAGTGVRASTDYEYEFIPFANSCTGSGTAIPASAASATGLPNTAGFAQRKLCLYAVLDGSTPASVEPDTYTLTVTLAITAP